MIKQDREFIVHYRNERDVEHPILSTVLRHLSKEMSSILDVGCYYSTNTYAQDIRHAFKDKIYEACDPCFDPEVEKVVDKLHTKKVESLPKRKYDLVTCISTIEHVGVTDKFDQEEQLKCFRSIVGVTKKALYITFPYGQPGFIPKAYANVTPQILELFTQTLKNSGFEVEEAFYYNPFPQAGSKWGIVDRSQADKVSIDITKGVQCVCVLLATKK